MFYEGLPLYQVIITLRLAKDSNISQERRFFPHVKVLNHSFFLHVYMVQDVNNNNWILTTCHVIFISHHSLRCCPKHVLVETDTYRSPRSILVQEPRDDWTKNLLRRNLFHAYRPYLLHSMVQPPHRFRIR